MEKADDNSKKYNEFVDQLVEFSTQTVLDHMQLMYEEYPQYIVKYFFSVATYKPLVASITDYYNTVFTSLLLKNDEDLLIKIAKMTKLGHRETCLLNMMLQLSLSFLHVVMEQHHKLDKSTVKNYITDIYNVIMDEADNKKKSLIEKMSKMHYIKTDTGIKEGQCTGAELSDCSVDKPLFNMNLVPSTESK